MSTDRLLEGSIPILRVGDTLLAAVHGDLRDRVAELFQADVLRRIEKTGATGLVIDISGLDTVDSYVARVLTDTGQMAHLMGTETVLVGMRPEVAATLVEMGYTVTGIRTALDVEAGFKVLADVLVARKRGLS